MSINSSSIDARMVVRANETEEHGFRVRLGSSTKLLLHENGGLKIGSNGTPPTDGIQIDGVAEKPGGGSWASSSDRRLKKDIQDYMDGLETLVKIRPVRYRYTEASGLRNDKEYIGIIAQDLQQIAPYMVYDEKSEAGESFLKVDFSAATYMLINAVKEQQMTIEALQKEIQQQNKEYTVLLSKIKEIEEYLFVSKQGE